MTDPATIVLYGSLGDCRYQHCSGGVGPVALAVSWLGQEKTGRQKFGGPTAATGGASAGPGMEGGDRVASVRARRSHSRRSRKEMAQALRAGARAARGGI